MQNPRYALVAYVKNPVGEFVENLRHELQPELPYLAAHLTILPPRILNGSETAALQTLEAVCGQTEPFEIVLGEIDTFIPVTATVYIRVAQGASQVSELHDRLNTQALQFKEEWSFVPHVTIVKMAAEAAAQNVFRIASERWSCCPSSRRILLERLTFVREEEQNCWVDLAPVVLGRTLVPR